VIRGQNRLTNRLREGMAEKRCPACTRWFPATAEHFHRKGPRLHSSCKACNREYMRPISRENYERRKARAGAAA
jgi:hypothetical protein